MTTKQALLIVLRAASANASGSDNAAEIMQAVRLVQQFPAPKAKLTLTKQQADRLILILAMASIPGLAQLSTHIREARGEYVALIHAYEAAGYGERVKDE